MKPPITFFAPGTPKGQPRPRACVRGKHAGMYDPGTAELWKREVAAAAKAHIPSEPWDCPIVLHLRFLMPRPKAHFGKKGMKVGAPYWHSIKPDADNLGKAIMDVMTTLAFWMDDSQVVHLSVTKRYMHTSGTSGCQIEINEAIQQP